MGGDPGVAILDDELRGTPSTVEERDPSGSHHSTSVSACNAKAGGG
jgi:hypothetical protein